MEIYDLNNLVLEVITCVSDLNLIVFTRNFNPVQFDDVGTREK
eukprot:CAMPEP_0201725356 /NCGR_PEP_ID=MMETSP0593-20130828/8782_1 /ASSEMBLY_ACC=CAM_ASM_000672 /TAXON_ID=267983 /ORGANISM="Skeletonema japonicum, Strain CCMP2506" /LENGTH=42 /DNA_ID= /DNA_START= /DNA_END= /DNA_ORIENTATION=